MMFGRTNWFFMSLVFLAGFGAAGLIAVTLAFAVVDISETSALRGLSLQGKPVTLSLVADKEEYAAGDPVIVRIMLDSGRKEAAGVDVVLRYDPLLLAIQRTGKGDGADAYLKTDDSIFDIFPYVKVNEESGDVFFTALAKPLKEMREKGPVAALLFTARAPGTAKMTFVFEEGSIIDSNVAYFGKDLLKKAHGTHVIIK